MRRGADVRPQLDRRRIEPQDGVPRAGVGEGVDEIDVGVGLQVDVRRGKGGVQGRRADLRLARSRQAPQRIGASRDDLQDIGVEEPGARHAEGGERGDDGFVGDPDVGGGSLDEAAVAAVRRADVELTAYR